MAFPSYLGGQNGKAPEYDSGDCRFEPCPGYFISGSGAMVAYLLWKQGVAGSSPAFQTDVFKRFLALLYNLGL